MKKWLTSLLLLICVTATLYPCCSKDECCNDYLIAAGNHDKHKSEGNCSPFVSCGTCPGFTQMTDAIEIAIIQEEPLLHHSKEVSSSIQNYSGSLLRPPRSL